MLPTCSRVDGIWAAATFGQIVSRSLQVGCTAGCQLGRPLARLHNSDVAGGLWLVAGVMRQSASRVLV